METNSFLDCYLEPFRALLIDTSLVELAINPDGQVWVEHQGTTTMSRADGLERTPQSTLDLARAIAGATQGQLSDRRPLLSGKVIVDDRPLRAQVVLPPAVENGPAIALRRFGADVLALNGVELLHGQLIDLSATRRDLTAKVIELAATGQIDEAMTEAVANRFNIVVSGGTSSGKTTFARALLSKVNATERILTIEDAFEIFPPQPNAVMLRSERQDGSATNPARLLEAALRLRPDRIILGELRGDESKTFLDAINTGHAGSFTTIHADSAEKAIDRLTLMVLSVGINMSFAEVRRYCAHSIDLVVQLGRSEGRRGVVEVWAPNH